MLAQIEGIASARRTIQHVPTAAEGADNNYKEERL
jgi:hypothetical protein